MDLKNSVSDPGAPVMPGEPPGWYGYLFTASRAGLFLFLAGVFVVSHLLPWLMADPASILVTESDNSVSKAGIIRAIAAFKLYNAATAYLLFTLSAVLARTLADKVRPGLAYAGLAAVYSAAGFAALLLLYGMPSPSGLALVLLCSLAAAHAGAVPGARPGGAVLAVFPGLAEALSPASSLSPGRGALYRAGLVFYALSAALSAADFCLNGGRGLASLKAAPAQIARGNFYGIEADQAGGRLRACRTLERKLATFSLADGGLISESEIATSLELQEVRTNLSRGEAYHFDRRSRSLLVLDAGTLSVARSAGYGGFDAGGSARVAFDNGSGTIAAVLEHGPMFIADMKTLRPKAAFREIDFNEFVLFDPFAGSYLLSFFRGRDTLEAVSADGKSRRTVPAGRFQGGLAISEKRREIYLAMPLRGSILVYDAATLEPRGAIRSVFGVRGLACDDENGVLLAASMSGGYAEAIRLEDRKRLLRVPLGYYLREIAFDRRARRAYVTSMLDGVLKFDY